MKNIKLTAISLALLFSFFHLDSSTGDKTAGKQVPSLKNLTMSYIRSVTSPGYIFNTVISYLQANKYENAVNFLRKSNLPEKELIQFLQDLMSDSTDQIFQNDMKLPYQLFLDILIQSQDLHNNEAIQALKKELIQSIKALVPGGPLIIDREKDRDVREQLLETLINTLVIAGVNFKNTFGATLLTTAINILNPDRLHMQYKKFKNNDKFAKFLINTGEFDPNIVDDRGQSPLVAAIHSKSFYLVQDLMAHGAKPGQKELAAIGQYSSGSAYGNKLNDMETMMMNAIENEATGQASSAASSSSS